MNNENSDLPLELQELLRLTKKYGHLTFKQLLLKVETLENELEKCHVWFKNTVDSFNEYSVCDLHERLLFKSLDIESKIRKE